MQLQAALQGFLVQLRADGRSPHTIGQYRRHGTALATWLSDAGIGTDLGDLTPEVLARFFASDAARGSCRGGPKTAVTLNAMRTSIRCFCSHLHQSGLLAANPARLLRRARCAPPPPKALHPDEQQRLLQVLAVADGPEAARDRMLVELLLYTGIRIGSALALDVPDIDLAHGDIALHTTKGDRPTTAILPTAIADKLRVFLGGRADGPVFLAGDRRVSMRQLSRTAPGPVLSANGGRAENLVNRRRPSPAMPPHAPAGEEAPSRDGGHGSRPSFARIRIRRRSAAPSALLDASAAERTMRCPSRHAHLPRHLEPMNLPSRLLALLLSASLSPAVAAQLEIATVYADAAYKRVGLGLFNVGDVDGDGFGDFVVGQEEATTQALLVQLVSGATRTQIGPDRPGGVVVGGGDLDLDGLPDLLVASGNQLVAYRGIDMAPLWTKTSTANFVSPCIVDDLDGDGRDDVVVGTFLPGVYTLTTLRGSDGQQIATTGSLTYAIVTIVGLGDALGTGDDAIAVRFNDGFRIYRTAPLSFVRDLAVQNMNPNWMRAANVAGDNRLEVAIQTNGRLYLCSPQTGQVLSEVNYASGGTNRFAVVGDLDGDGYDDFVTPDADDRDGWTAQPNLAFRSSATSALLGHWPHAATFWANRAEGVGDIDGDGIGDLLLGDDTASPTPQIASTRRGGYQLISTRVRARTFEIPVHCTGGPFAPELGMTRPLLGQTTTFVGRDCPANAAGLLTLSAQPEAPLLLGFPGCDAWIDLSSLSILAVLPPAATWTFPVTLPNIPQLAGLAIATQALYTPTTSPTGFDLSNAIWARIGF